MLLNMEYEDTWVVSEDLIKLVILMFIIFLIYFLSVQLQNILAFCLKHISKYLGTFSNSKEYALQRYVYQHSTGLVAKLYRWINEQLVALGMKKLGITVTGYLLFWATISFILSVVACIVFAFGIAFSPFLALLLLVVSLVMTRVSVSERMEKREADVMNAIDLIVPEIGNGVKNAIVAYKDTFSPTVRDEFLAFITNVQDRGYSFEDAMYILTDNLGSVFQDFSQKAIYFESSGEADMVDIFTDITETNRLRRQLRDENTNAFRNLKTTFIVAAGLTTAYFFFLMFTDEFSRVFFLQSTGGKFLLIVMVGIVFAVLAYITTIKSRVI